MKIFISQPMIGKSEREIVTERTMIINKLSERYSEFDILESYFPEIDSENTMNTRSKAIKHLAMSINLLAEADLVVFLYGWNISRGCRMEEIIANTYGIDCLYLTGW